MLLQLRSSDGRYTIGGLMLVFFSSQLGSVATKEQLVTFLRAHRCRTTDPQPRHMGMQCGLNFLVSGCWHPRLHRVLRRGEYCLLDLRNAHPSLATMHRAKGINIDFDAIKSAYSCRCACCGSEEDQAHLKNALLVTTLERGHCDPRLPLSSENCIPMCKMCNMVYKDNAVLSKRGFVVSWLKDSSTSVVLHKGGICSDNVEQQVHQEQQEGNLCVCDYLNHPFKFPKLFFFFAATADETIPSSSSSSSSSSITTPGVLDLLVKTAKGALSFCMGSSCLRVFGISLGILCFVRSFSSGACFAGWRAPERG